MLLQTGTLKTIFASLSEPPVGDEKNGQIGNRDKEENKMDKYDTDIRNIDKYRNCEEKDGW